MRRSGVLQRRLKSLRRWTRAHEGMHAKWPLRNAFQQSRWNRCCMTQHVIVARDSLLPCLCGLQVCPRTNVLFPIVGRLRTCSSAPAAQTILTAGSLDPWATIEPLSALPTAQCCLTTAAHDGRSEMSVPWTATCVPARMFHDPSTSRIRINLLDPLLFSCKQSALLQRDAVPI